MKDSRRSLLIIGSLAAALIALAAGGCQEPPVAAVQRAKLALEAAANAGAIVHAEPDYRAAETLLQAGRMEIARQQGRLKPFRDYAAADSVLALAALAARRAEHDAAARARALEAQARQEHDLLRDELAAHRQALDGGLVIIHAERYWSQANLALQTGRRLIAEREFVAAAEKCAEGRRALVQVGRLLAQHLEDEAKNAPIWRRWVQETLVRSRQDRGHAIIVDKSRHKLYLIREGKLVRSYDCDLGYNSIRQKMFQGDGATPEGQYQVTGVKNNGASRYYRALPLNYPNAHDLERLRVYKRRGVISASARPGGNIEIHGHGGRNEDWTEGCVALRNDELDHLMRHVGKGTPVTIVRRSDQWP